MTVAVKARRGARSVERGAPHPVHEPVTLSEAGAAAWREQEGQRAQCPRPAAACRLPAGLAEPDPPPDPFDLLQVAIARLIVGKSDPARELPAGRYQVRGVCTVAVDCWVDKLAAIEAREPFPTREILAVALGLAARPDRLESLLLKAARQVLGRQAGEKLPLLDRALLAVDGVHDALLDELPRVPKQGQTKVTGRATLTEWTPIGDESAVRRVESGAHADGAGGCTK